jgi:hypothetical protein
VCAFCGQRGGIEGKSHYTEQCPTKPVIGEEKVTVQKFSVDNDEGVGEKLVSSEGIGSNEQLRFEKFLDIIYNVYVLRYKMCIRFSTLGVVMNQHSVTLIKHDLKRFTERAQDLGFMRRQGKEGNTEAVFDGDVFKRWKSGLMGYVKYIS